MTKLMKLRLQSCSLIGRAGLSSSTLYRSAILSRNMSGGITNWASSDGQFKRQQSKFRDEISSDAGAKFPAEKKRYHLYVSLACPWAHRALIVRELKGLQEILPISVVHYEMLEGGWRFLKEEESCGGATKDLVYGSSHLKDLYFKADKSYDGRYTVPTLWDTKTETIVNNESSEIIRMLYHAFDDLIDAKYKGVTYYPDSLKKEIDSANEWIYDTVNNGVYKTGFATTQDAYEANIVPLFDSLNRIEEMLSKGGPYLLGQELSEADIRLYPTIVRFDPVYVQHFKCDLGTIRHNYPLINKWLKNLYWNNDAFKLTTNFEHIKKHYTKSHKQINPNSITPLGPLPHVEPEDDGEVLLKVGKVTLNNLVPDTDSSSHKHTLKHQMA